MVEYLRVFRHVGFFCHCRWSRREYPLDVLRAFALRISISVSLTEDYKMLVLSRRFGESIVIDGGITATVLKMKGNVVQLGFDAPREVSIRRSEICERGRKLELPLVI